MTARWLALCALVLLATGGAAQTPPAWSEPVAPFRIAGPIHYVGTRGLAVYAVVTSAGTALIGGPLAADAPLVLRNLAAIGVAPAQIRLLLNMHAHFDHAGALAAIKAASGARVVASAGDAPALRRGQHQGDNSNGATRFPPVAVDRIVRDGETVAIGPAAITATVTPGHTPGCTTWSMTVRDHGRPLRVVFPCSLSIAGNILVGNRGYPGIVADYRRSFARLGRMRADIMLPSHPEFGQVLERHARRDAGDVGAFVDRTLLPRTVAAARHDFAAALPR